MRNEFCALLDATDQDPNLKAVIITGTDPAFTAGVDFKESVPSFDPRARRSSVNPGRALRAMTKPVVSAVNGACVSGGLEIALSCSFMIASERARFADTHARLNVIPAWGLTALLPRAVGVRKALEMSATGQFINSEEAARIGLGNHVVPHTELMQFTFDLVNSIVGNPAIAEIAFLYRHGEDLGINASLQLEAERVANGLQWNAASFEALRRAVASRRENPVG
jgi:enoyl-CoA hydratase